MLSQWFEQEITRTPEVSSRSLDDWLKNYSKEEEQFLLKMTRDFLSWWEEQEDERSLISWENRSPDDHQALMFQLLLLLYMNLLHAKECQSSHFPCSLRIKFSDWFPLTFRYSNVKLLGVVAVKAHNIQRDPHNMDGMMWNERRERESAPDPAIEKCLKAGRDWLLLKQKHHLVLWFRMWKSERQKRLKQIPLPS